MIVSLIAAIGKNGELGLKGQIPWHIPEDFKHFKQTTLGHHLVMGRKTFESIGKPLPGRKTIVLSRSRFKASGIDIVDVPSKALELCAQRGEAEVFIAGGTKINKLIFGLTLGILIALYCLVLPTLARKNQKVMKLVQKFAIPIPRGRHVLAYLVIFLLVEINPSPKRGELVEFGGTLMFFLMFLNPWNKRLFQADPYRNQNNYHNRGRNQHRPRNNHRPRNQRNNNHQTSQS